MDLFDPSSDQEYGYRYTVEFDAGNETETIQFVTDTSDKELVRSLAWDAFADEMNVDIGVARERWRITRTGVGYADAPWDTLEEATEMIRALDGVTRARLQRPMDMSSWGATKILVLTEEPNVVQEELEELYEPLSLVEERGGHVVFPTALPDYV